MAESTLASRALGRLLVRHRERAKISRDAASRIVETSTQTMGRLEEGRKPNITDLWINVLSDAYGVRPEERKVLLDLAKEVRTDKGKGAGWWRAYATQMGGGFDHFLSLEQVASRMTTWQPTLLPGLLQTSDYRRANAWAEDPNGDHDSIEMRVHSAILRQERLKDESFQVDALLSEAVLRNKVGGPSVMEEQSQRLLELSELPNVSIRVVPFSATNTIGLVVGSFVHLGFDQSPTTGLVEPPIIYVEGHTGALYLEEPDEVARYTTAVDRIRKVALSESETRKLVTTVAKESA